MALILLQACSQTHIHTHTLTSSNTCACSQTHMHNTCTHRMLDELHRAHDSLEESVQSSTAAGLSKLQGVEAQMTSMQESLSNDLKAVAKEVRKPPEVSYADLQALTARVDQAAAELGVVGQSMQHIKTKDIVQLQEQIVDIIDQMRKGQTRDMDTLFHNRLSQLEESLGDVKTEVQLAVADVLEDVVKVSDLQGLEGLIQERASQEDLRQLAQQQGSLAQSVSQVANWMANRPSPEEGPKAVAAAGIKMKCFTCDQEIKGPAAGASGSGTRSSESTLRPKTNFLPKLDHPHSSPSSHTVPLGPGINAAELRRLAEERMAGGSKKGSPLRGTEVEDYATDKSGASPGPGRSGRIPLPSHGLNSVVTRAPNRPPIFI
uniref:Uncharacterized protein n=1 Tax=Dunaliella tertiolecta TaxID=3047 RepID=A0A6S8I9Q6_DUNTE|mmetsp:Transcript_1397/g.3367  ORF Transcript_1397/g.3367 Transcript_1397/m.3367 type:complete len:376 (-) Transcript_1397:272-1399(-)